MSNRTVGTPEQILKKLKKLPYEAAYKSLGYKEKFPRKVVLEWWNIEIEELVTEKKAACNKWLMTKDVDDRKEYTRIRRETNKTKNYTW